MFLQPQSRVFLRWSEQTGHNKSIKLIERINGKVMVVSVWTVEGKNNVRLLFRMALDADTAKVALAWMEGARNIVVTWQSACY